ncbi:MAG: 16S rRNA processing protein RimM [Thermoleophilia bacterium]|nr:16S rRNA processing protein RimM [Thermoleophilia bacterium]
MSTDASSGERPSVLSVATLTKVHGVRGELKLRTTPELLAVLHDVAEQAVPVTLHLPDTGDEYEVTLAHVRGHESAPIAAIDGVTDRSAAEEFRGAEVRVPRELLPEPEEGEYFLADLVGCDVHDTASGERVGRSTKAESLPANVVVTIALDAGGTLLAPLVHDAMPVVDVDARRIDVDLAFLGVGEGE